MKKTIDIDKSVTENAKKKKIKHRKSRLTRLLTVTTVLAVSYAMIIPGTATSSKTYCKSKDKNHEHTPQCYSNPNADKETEKDWKKLANKIEKTDSASKYLLAMAKDQMGYQESEDNFKITNDGLVKGYTRYGDFDGDPYKDWNFSFVKFLLYYGNATVDPDLENSDQPNLSGNVDQESNSTNESDEIGNWYQETQPETANDQSLDQDQEQNPEEEQPLGESQESGTVLSQDLSVKEWMEELENKDLLKSADYMPKEGDIVFFEKAGSKKTNTSQSAQDSQSSDDIQSQSDNPQITQLSNNTIVQETVGPVAPEEVIAENADMTEDAEPTTPEDENLNDSVETSDEDIQPQEDTNSESEDSFDTEESTDSSQDGSSDPIEEDQKSNSEILAGIVTLEKDDSSKEIIIKAIAGDMRTEEQDAVTEVTLASEYLPLGYIPVFYVPEHQDSFDETDKNDSDEDKETPDENKSENKSDTDTTETSGKETNPDDPKDSDEKPSEDSDSEDKSDNPDDETDKDQDVGLSDMKKPETNKPDTDETYDETASKDKEESNKNSTDNSDDKDSSSQDDPNAIQEIVLPDTLEYTDGDLKLTLQIDDVKDQISNRILETRKKATAGPVKPEVESEPEINQEESNNSKESEDQSKTENQKEKQEENQTTDENAQVQSADDSKKSETPVESDAPKQASKSSSTTKSSRKISKRKNPVQQVELSQLELKAEPIELDLGIKEKLDSSLNLEGNLVSERTYKISLVADGVETDLSGIPVAASVSIEKATEIKEAQAARENSEEYPEGSEKDDSLNSIEPGYAVLTQIDADDSSTDTLKSLEMRSLNKNRYYIGTELRKTVFRAQQRTESDPNFTVQTYGLLKRNIPQDSRSHTKSTAYKEGKKYTSYDDHNDDIPIINQTNMDWTNAGITYDKQSALENTEYFLMESAGQDSAGKSLYQLAKGEKMSPLYESVEYTFLSHPGIQHVDLLPNDPGYSLSKIWKLKPEKRKEMLSELASQSKEGQKKAESILESTDKNYWLEYDSTAQITNRKQSEDRQHILIEENDVIRLIYTEKSSAFESGVSLYDYDETNNEKENDNGVQRWKTYQKGINTPLNENGKPQLAFGNANTGMGWELQKDSKGYFINKGDGDNRGEHPCYVSNLSNDTYMSSYPVFNLVESRLISNQDKNNGLQFNQNISAPDLFSTGNSHGANNYGKKYHNNVKLKFNQIGDHYTINEINGTEISLGNLSKFTHPGGYKQIWTNSFWPLDKLESTALKGVDPKTGGGTKTYYTGNKKDSFPASDDGIAHNNLFGMYYKINFEIPENYIGPLDYFFFGDDDLWVYVDGEKVIDLGGVHSSWGAYVDLSGKGLEKGKSHTLEVFYTERGLSGSTCYMEFNLPKVSGISTDAPTGELQVQKDIEHLDPAKEFAFKLTLQAPENTNYSDNNYPFHVYDTKTGQEVDIDKSNIQGDAAHTGFEFNLKGNQYALISNIPVGFTYVVEEVTGDGVLGFTVSYFDSNQNDFISGKSVQGTVSGGINHTSLVRIKNTGATVLPETGGPGINFITTSGYTLIIGTLVSIIVLKFKRKYDRMNN